MRRGSAIVGLLALVAAAMSTGGLAGGPAAGGVRSSDFQTTSTLTLYVSTTGSDSNGCQASGTSACLTLQGALNKIPKQVRNTVTVSMGAGTFAAGAYVDGFELEQYASNTTGSYIEIQGTLTTATAATGTASGTASAGTAGSGATFGTLTDSTQSWTSNDLRGKLIEITGGTGSGQFRVVDSNTSTAITVVGTWTAPSGTSTYVVHDWGTILSGDVNFPPQNSYEAVNTQGSSASIIVGALPYSAARVTMRWLKFTGQGAVGAVTGSIVEVAESRVEATRAFSTFMVGGGVLSLLRDSVSVPNNTASGLVTVFAGNQFFNSVRSLYQGSASGSVINASGTAYANISFNGDSLRNLANGIRADGLNAAILNERFDTITGTCVGTTGRSGVTNQYMSMGRLYVNVADMTSCGIAFDIQGNAAASAFGVISGSSNTTIYKVTNGGTIQESSTGTVSGTTEIDVDGTAYTVTALRALSPKAIVNLSTLSRVWEP